MKVRLRRVKVRLRRVQVEPRRMQGEPCRVQVEPRRVQVGLRRMQGEPRQVQGEPGRVKALSRGVLGVLLALVLAGCGSSFPPLPPTGPHLPDEVAVVVPYPPPPARAEIIPKSEQPGAVWIDGEWQWKSRRWAWLPGRWELPRRGAYFAPATTVRRADGTLVWFAGVWQSPVKK